VYTLRLWLLLCVVGGVGVLLHVASVEEIRVTSPLTHNVSSTAKVAVQTLFVAWVLGAALTFLGIVSVATVLAGSMAYALIRRMEHRARRAQSPYREEESVRLRRRSTATSLRNTR
jgi:GDP-fucose transporter C1